MSYRIARTMRRLYTDVLDDTRESLSRRTTNAKMPTAPRSAKFDVKRKTNQIFPGTTFPASLTNKMQNQLQKMEVAMSELRDLAGCSVDIGER